MAERILTNSLYDELRPGRYPFVDEAPLISSSGLTLEPDLILDAVLYPLGEFAELQMQAVIMQPRAGTFVVGDAEGNRVATAEFDPLQPAGQLQLVDPAGRPAGVFVMDTSRLAELQTWPLGTHSFLFGAAQFVASCIIPTPAVGVRAIQLADGELFVGDVWLVGDDGVVLRETEAGKIRVDVVGDPLFARRLCRPYDLFDTPRVLQTINGIPADDYGNFNLLVIDNNTGDTVLRVIPRGDGTLVLATAGQPLAGG